MDIFRVTARWSGFIGAPGYSSFYFASGGGLISDAQQVASRTAAAINRLASNLPETVSIDVESEVELLDADTGEVQGFEPVSVPTGVTGSKAGGYSAAAGAVVNWRTNDVRFGRRIRGRTFIVPLAGTSYEDDGSLTALSISSLGGFAGDMVGGDLDSEFGIWSRPRSGSGGVFATVTSYSIPDMTAVLRSRRD